MPSTIEYNKEERLDPYLSATKTVDGWIEQLAGHPTADNYEQLKFAIAILIRDTKPDITAGTYLHLSISPTLDGVSVSLNGNRKHLVNGLASLLEDNKTIRELIMDAFGAQLFRKIQDRTFNDEKGQR
jgi:hypothetical protein